MVNILGATLLRCGLIAAWSHQVSCLQIISWCFALRSPLSYATICPYCFSFAICAHYDFRHYHYHCLQEIWGLISQNIVSAEHTYRCLTLRAYRELRTDSNVPVLALHYRIGRIKWITVTSSSGVQFLWPIFLWIFCSSLFTLVPRLATTTLNGVDLNAGWFALQKRIMYATYSLPLKLLRQC